MSWSCHMTNVYVISGCCTAELRCLIELQVPLLQTSLQTASPCSLECWRAVHDLLPACFVQFLPWGCQNCLKGMSRLILFTTAAKALQVWQSQRKVCCKRLHHNGGCGAAVCAGKFAPLLALCNATVLCLVGTCWRMLADLLEVFGLQKSAVKLAVWQRGVAV